MDHDSWFHGLGLRGPRMRSPKFENSDLVGQGFRHDPWIPETHSEHVYLSCLDKNQ